MGETPAPSTALKSIISHKGIQMSPAAPFEVFDYYVTKTNGCCWQKFSETKPWDYLSVPRTTPAEYPKGSQSVRFSCFIICSPFSPLVFSDFSGFLFWLQALIMGILSPRLPAKHLLPLCCWEDSGNMVCFSPGKSHLWKWVFVPGLPSLGPEAKITSSRPGWRQLLLGFHCLQLCLRRTGLTSPGSYLSCHDFATSS